MGMIVDGGDIHQCRPSGSATLEEEKDTLVIVNCVLENNSPLGWGRPQRRCLKQCHLVVPSSKDVERASDPSHLYGVRLWICPKDEKHGLH